MKGIDISTWQEKVDYSKLKSQGIEFVIIRCGYGKNESQKDNMFEKHYKGCKNAGLKVGAYLYSYVTSIENAKLEAENCLKFIKGKQFDLPIYYDVEDKIIQPLGRITITQCIIEFCKIIEQAGFKAGIYANLNWFNNYIDVDKISNYSLWVAQWNNTCTAKFNYDIWQYTSNGKIEGIAGRVDMNILYNESYSQVEDKVVNKKSNEELANEVIAGKWGNGQERVEKLTKSGYDYNVVQKIVNNKMKNKTKVNDIKKGDYILFKGTTDYYGVRLDDWTYNSKFNVIEVKGDRVVIGKGSIVTAAVKKSDCIKV